MSEERVEQKPSTFERTRPLAVKGNRCVSEDFDAFVREKLRSVATGGRLDLELEKQFWLGKLDELYATIRDCLSDYIEAGEIIFKVSDFPMHDRFFGSYTAQQAQILLGRDVVTLKPVGTFLVANRGRVNLIGGSGTAAFVVVPPNAERVSVTCAEYFDAIEGATTSLVLPPENWVWKIKSARPRGIYVNLNFDSFRDVLVGVMGGILGEVDE